MQNPQLGQKDCEEGRTGRGRKEKGTEADWYEKAATGRRGGEKRREDTEEEEKWEIYGKKKNVPPDYLTTGVIAVISIITSISWRGCWCTITHVTMSGWTTT